MQPPNRATVQPPSRPSVLLDPLQRPIIAHRGASADAPENTLAAFTSAVEQGCDALELDVRLSGDGVPVVVHDATLERTTDRRGAVARVSATELRAADAGARFTPDGGVTYPWRNRGVRIPMLAEVLESFPDLPLLIELKTRTAQRAVADLLVRCRATARCVVAAADHEAVRVFRTGATPVGASRREIASLYLRAHVGLPPPGGGYRVLAVPERHRGLPVPTTPFVRAARRVGCPVHVWTVDRPDVARRLWRRGVSGIITNRPREMERARRAAHG